MKLPVDTRLKTEKLIEDRKVIPERRGYLGISSIGKECPRALWYDFRFCSEKEYSARLERLFQRGHREEPIILNDLKSIGIEIHSDQKEVVTGYGHIKGHIDGAANNVPDAPKTTHLLEFKTMKEGLPSTKNRKATYFYLLKEKGVKISNPLYYIQCQCYMYLLGWKRTLFIAVNKNNDERHYERLALEPSVAKFAIQRGQDIIFNETPSPKVETYKCNWCVHKPLCLQGAAPLKNCRTCQYCDMQNEGKWSCSEKEKSGILAWLSLEQQVKGCSDWRLLHTLGG